MIEGEGLWMVITGFVISFALAFGIGANDVANSFGTSVGSKVLTLKQACILATIFEILGAILIGAKVSGTIRKGILDPMIFTGSETELMLGYVSALAGCCIWLIVATVLNLPVSGTHSIVGATIGMALVSRGIHVIKWLEILKIVASWFISPLLSGLVSVVLFILIRRFILRAENPLKAGLKYLPLIYTLTIVVNVGGILEASPPLLKFDVIPWWGKIIIGAGIAVTVYLVVLLLLVPRMRKQITKFLEKTEKINEAMQMQETKFIENNETEDQNNNQIDAPQKTISTQVDHIALIIANDPIHADFLKERELMDIQNKKYKPKKKLEQQQQTKAIAAAADIDGEDDSDHEQQTSKTVTGLPTAIKGRARRRRLDSAPSYDNSDSDYNGDVNFTLSGYLHTIHSFRQYMLTHNRHHHQPQLPSIQSASAVREQQQNNKVPLSKMFEQPATTVNNENVEQTNDVNKEAEKPLIDDGGVKQVGRFITSKPAKFEVTETKLTTKENISKESIDAEIEENLGEFPHKVATKPVIDDELANNDPPEAAKLFSFLQILTAVFGSFAHGGNDVSNAIGPLIGLYLIYQDGRIINKADTPEWILFYGGVGISVGLWILGRRVIKTIGEDLTKITPSSGFVIELASAMTVLAASLVNIPVSTTHCKVGSVVFTGRIRAKQSVDWSLFRNIIIAWIVTVPVTGSIAAGCQAALTAIFIKR